MTYIEGDQILSYMKQGRPRPLLGRFLQESRCCQWARPREGRWGIEEEEGGEVEEVEGEEDKVVVGEEKKVG